MPVRMTPVKSVTIDAIGYDEEREELHITFAGGRQYTYDGVSSHVYQAFMAATSKGQFFHANIKDQYGERG